MNELSLQAARAVIYQDLDDPTSFKVRVTDGVGGDPVDLSGRAWSDPDGLMDPIDTTNAAAGELGVSCAAQTEDNHDFRIVADAGTADAVTYLKGVLVVGSTRHVATSGTLTLALEDQSITIAAVVPDHAHSGAYLSAAALYIDAGRMIAVTGAAASGKLGVTPVWLLDSGSNEAVGFSVVLPAGWATYDLVVESANAGAGAGDYVIRVDKVEAAAGDDLSASSQVGTSATITAAAQNIQQDTTIASGIAVPAAGDTLSLRLTRLASADTLANDAAIKAIRLEKAS